MGGALTARTAWGASTAWGTLDLYHVGVTTKAGWSGEVAMSCISDEGNLEEVALIETSAVVAITARLYSMRATLFASVHQTSTRVHHIPPPDLSTLVHFCL